MAIDAKPKQLFDIGSIQDPVLRNNFEVLNRELLKRQIAQQVAPANIVYSDFVDVDYTLGGALVVDTIYIIPKLTCTIQTKGNPVSVKLLPNPGTGSGWTAYVAAAWILGTGAHDVSALTVGYYRSSATEAPKIVSQSATQITAVNGATGPGIIYSYPFCEIEDEVPAGVWTYTFFWQVRHTYAGLILSRTRMRALELR